MPSRKTTTPRAAVKKRAAVNPASSPSVSAPAQPLLKLAQELRRWTDNVLGMAGSAAELSLNMAKVRARGPTQHAAIDKAASLLRQSREAAGLTTRELGKAIDLNDPALLEAAEHGKAALPFEIILRLAGILGRNDPATFAMQLARSYNPALWKALEDYGIGRMVVQAGRERELANLYRGSDDARRLSDKDFAEVLGFVKTAFDMAVTFRAPPAKSGKAAKA